MARMLRGGACTLNARTDPDITLEGLRLLADRNPVPVFHHSALRDPLRSDSD